MITATAPAVTPRSAGGVGSTGNEAEPRTDLVWIRPSQSASTSRPALSTTPRARFVTRTFVAETVEHVQFVDITEHVAQCVAAAGIQEGSVHVFSRHTTACIRINENEPLLLQDMVDLLERVAPIRGHYRHDDFGIRTVNLHEDERVNGHSHCRSLLLGASETIPVSEGRLLLGQWQSVFLTELDGPAQREFVVQVSG